MKTFVWKAGIAVAIVLVAVAVWWEVPHAGAGGAEPKPAEAAPVAQVRTELPQVQRLAQTMDATGEVVPGQVQGLSFARPGQVTRLSVVAGDHVARGQVVATLVPDPSTRQAWQQAVDAQAAAQREWQRQKELAEGHLATQSQVDAAEKASRDAASALRALQEQGGAGEGELRSPVDGVVTSVAIAQGDRVQAGAAVLQVGRSDVLKILVGVEPRLRSAIQRGAVATVWPDGSIDEKAPHLALQVDAVQDAIDPKTQLLDVVVDCPHATSASLAPGMHVAVRIVVATVSALAVTRDAVLSDDQGDYVFQVRGGKAHRVAVVKTLETSDRVALKDLADRQDPVVIVGNYELQEGMAVEDAGK